MTRAPLFLNLGLVVVSSVFLLAPDLDLAVSALFFRPDGGFWLKSLPSLEIIRRIFWSFGDSLGLLGGALWLASRRLGPDRKVPSAIWAYAFATMALGPGILVNVVVKPIWSRARPADVLQFGGAREFTPAYMPTDQCARGCSFVSGEAASAVAMAIIIGVLLWPALRRKGRIALGGVLALAAVLASGLRVATGRHFLSDIMFGGFLAAYVAWWLFHALQIDAARRGLRWAAVRADLRAMGHRLMGSRGNGAD